MNEISATFRPPITIFLMAGALTTASFSLLQLSKGSFAYKNVSKDHEPGQAEPKTINLRSGCC